MEDIERLRNMSKDDLFVYLKKRFKKDILFSSKRRYSFTFKSGKESTCFNFLFENEVAPFNMQGDFIILK